jgi:hypothetical protein
MGCWTRPTGTALLAIASLTLAACGNGKGSPGQNDATVGDATKTNAEAGTGEADGGGPHDANGLRDGGSATDGAGLDAGSDVADAKGSDAGATDAGCVSPSGPTTACGPHIATCNYATSYCYNGSVPNACLPIPAECQCEQKHTCACVLAHLSCDGGTLACSTFEDGGELWVENGGCRGSPTDVP